MAEPMTNHGRRIRWLGIAVALVAAVYTAGWFYVADVIEKRAAEAIADANRGGVSAECANPAARGFPFRIGLWCDRVAYADAARGLGVTAGPFRSAGQIYDPLRLVAELDGPARVETAAGGVDLAWQALRASVRLQQPVPKRLSLEGRDLSAAVQGKALASVGAFDAHMRPNGADLDLAGSFDGLVLDPALLQGRVLPPLSSRSDLTVVDGVALLGAAEPSLRGRAGTIRTLSLTAGPTAGLTLAGPFSFDADGLLDANLQVTVSDPMALAEVLAAVFPENADAIRRGLAGIAALGGRSPLPLMVVKGRAALGFIPLGDVPPV